MSSKTVVEFKSKLGKVNVQEIIFDLGLYLLVLVFVLLLVLPW